MAKKFGLTTGIVFVSIQIGGYTKNDDINLSLNGFDNPPTGVKCYVTEIKGLLNYSSKHMNRAENPQYDWRSLLRSLRTSAAKFSHFFHSPPVRMY